METMNADIGDSKAIFNALHSRVENSPVYSTFYRVLYNLYLIENSQSDSGQIWYSIEKIVKEVTKAECNEDPQSLVGETHPLPIHTLESKETQTSWDTNTFPNLCSEGDENTLKDALNENSESGGVMTELAPAPPLPPPPPPPSAPPRVPETPLAPPIPIPEPKCRVKHIMWNKISNVPSEKKNIWRDILEMPDKIEVEYADLENFFANNENENASPRTECKSKVPPLNQNRKLNVEIFLKNCGRPIKDIIQLLQYGDYEKFEVEKLKRLKEVLPQRDEIEFFQNFEGNAENLEDAEKFLFYMTHLPNHEFRTEVLILKADFNAQLKTISSQSEFFLKTCDLICEDQSLKIFLRYVLHTGNFLNKGSKFGNARGIRIPSLKILMDTKSSSTCKMSFLHYLVETSEQGDPGALKFVETLQEPLENASRFLESLYQIPGQGCEGKSIYLALTDRYNDKM
ncbi:inverted formin-2-like isoform X2 [Saccostrea cucullata]|uniref:inverted formin-2-like isoform X2 n=1 Tax=Saccostrea cuccullata TaxID=36930 RepID=UPI002ED68926